MHALATSRLQQAVFTNSLICCAGAQLIVIVIVIFKQGVRSAQADFQRSPVYITHIKQHN